MADSFAVTFKMEYTLVNVVTVVHRNVTIGGFGSPQLRRNINDKGMSGRRSEANNRRTGRERRGRNGEWR
jgi:hypothetical protein